ncbi:hypothetical protein PIB30_028589 [Stylosanthes scabra]|uniref:Uncharacterized protein n=1 Tax=Stylosanthes scabra TaxID=79078 RepID=A0ABU6W938_9FABA|nr:hypothetical protein [Stylosanthes scabra]
MNSRITPNDSVRKCTKLQGCVHTTAVYTPCPARDSLKVAHGNTGHYPESEQSFAEKSLGAPGGPPERTLRRSTSAKYLRLGNEKVYFWPKLQCCRSAWTLESIIHAGGLLALATLGSRLESFGSIVGSSSLVPSVGPGLLFCDGGLVSDT